MKLFHSDKTRDGDDTAGKVLNDAKERALKEVVTEKSMSLGDKAQQRYEELGGVKFDEERLDLLWKILTDQNSLPDASNQTKAEQPEIVKRWMNKDNFKQDIFGMMSRGLTDYDF